jgi:dTDP-4-dehydro-6-deoxy-alpha-D-glucopyranose 2,3-dehydratase
MNNNHFEFLKSALYKKEINTVINWVEEQNKAIDVSINKVMFCDLEKWVVTKNSIKHDTGKFFSIDGIRVNTSWGYTPSWDQPIINQPEIGYLGFIVKEFDGVLHFLTQAKIEPGNVNIVQLSPTLQATRSNYQQTHKGKKPAYLEYFQHATKQQILLDQLQSEQGARFLRKRNRNIIIKISDDIPILSNFIWLTLGQLKSLMQIDNIVNMDTRTVISGIDYGRFSNETINMFTFLQKSKNYQTMFLKSALSGHNAKYTTEEIITFITELKSTYDLDIENIPISKMDCWEMSESEISHIENKYFKIIGVEVSIANREVTKWFQPMVEPCQEGLCAFVCKELDGVLHLAVQAKLECGNQDIIELAPTVQTLTGNYKNTDFKLPFLDYVLTSDQENIYLDTIQSEEGGRFYREQNRNMIVIGGNELSEQLPEKFIWMTLNQLNVFLKFNNYLNIQARNLIASIPFV